MTDLPFKPIVILGAGRSGTNMLRDALCAMPDIETWPCDEIQPIWRHGNLSHPTDAISSELASADVKRFIRNAFTREWLAKGRPAFLVEKTCANTLRIPFVAEVLPEAQFISIFRHGADVVASAKARWEGNLEVPPIAYFAAKARYIPASDLHIYAWRFLQNRIHTLTGRDTRLRVWGPVWEGFREQMDLPLEEICAHQWVACVSATRADLEKLNPPYINVLYEDYLADPERETERILRGIGYRKDLHGIAKAVSKVRRKSKSMGGRDLSSSAVRSILSSECQALGYEV